MTAKTLANPAIRAGLYHRLRRRNRLIGFLRFLVPLLGMVLFGFLVAEIVISKMVNDYGISDIRLEQDRLLIETPQYEGVTETGTRYRVVAKTAFTLISEADTIELHQAVLDVVRPDGVSYHATAERALYNLIAQTVDVPGSADVVDSRKTVSKLHNTFVDWHKQIIDARSGAVVTFADGTRLVARSLVMYGEDNRWDMTDVILDTPATEEEP